MLLRGLAGCCRWRRFCRVRRQAASTAAAAAAAGCCARRRQGNHHGSDVHHRPAHGLGEGGIACGGEGVRGAEQAGPQALGLMASVTLLMHGSADAWSGQPAGDGDKVQL